MGVPVVPSCHPKTGLGSSETEQELRQQLEESKEKFHELQGRFLVSEATVYAMANELQKHNCRKFKDIVESVLGEKLLYRERRLTQKLRLAQNLRECNFQIQEQDQKLALFQQKLQQGRDAAFLLCQHLKDLFTQDHLHSSQGHGFRELLTEGCRLAEDLVRMLSPENHKDGEKKKEYESLFPRMSPEGANKEKVQQVLQHSLLGQPKSASQNCDLCTQQPPWTTGYLRDDRECSYFLEEAYTQDVENQDKEEAPVVHRDIPEKEDKNNVPQDKLDENLLAFSHCLDLCDSQQSDESPEFLTEKHVAPSNLNMAKKKDNEEHEKEQESQALRLSTEGIDKEKIAEALPDLLGEDSETSVHHCDLADNQEPCCTTALLSGACEVSSSLAAAQNTKDCKDEVPKPKAPRKYCTITQYHAKKPTQLHEQLSEGKEASLPLGQHLEFLLTEDDPDDHLGQGHMKGLAQGCQMAENIVLKLSAANNEQGNNEKEGKALLSDMDDPDGDFNFLTEVQVRDLTKLRQKLKEVQDAACMLHENLSNYLAEDNRHRRQVHGHRNKLAEWCKMAKCLAHKLSPDNLGHKDEDDQMTLDSSLCDEVQEKEVKELPDSSGEQYVHPARHPGAADLQECGSRAVFPSEKPEACSELDGSTTSKEACLQGLLNGELSSQLSEAASFFKAQIESCIQEEHPPGIEKCQHFDYDDCKARLSLSPTTWSFAVHTHSEVNLDASLGMKNPPKLEGDACEGSAAITHAFPSHGFCDADRVLKQKIIKRKLGLCKWKMACRFPGLHLNSDASLGTKNPPKLEGDAFEGSAAITHKFPVHGLRDVDSILKQDYQRKTTQCK